MSLLLFDLDGTLVDSAPAVKAAADRLRARKGLLPVALEVVRAQLSEPSGGEAALLVPEGSSGKDLRDALMVYGRFLQEDFAAHAVLYPGVRALLETLRARGIRCALVSSRLTLFLYEVLHHAGLEGFFDPVLGADAVAHPPPAPDLVLAALAQTGVPAAEALLVSDGVADLEAARAAGVATAFAAYGYGAPPAFPVAYTLHTPDDLRAWPGR